MTKEPYDVGQELALFRALRRKHRIPGQGPVYTKLKDSPYFAAAALGDPDACARLHALASDLLKKERTRATDERRAQKRRDLAVNGIPHHERYRAEVVSREFARLARMYGEHSWEAGGVRQFLPSMLQQFRDRFFGGHALTPAQADALLSSPAAALLLADDFEEGGIPAIGHESKIIKHSQTHDPNHPGHYIEDLLIHATWPGRKQVKAFAFKRTWKHPLPRLLVHVKGSIGELGIRPLSLFDCLKDVADKLANHYGWGQADAVRFVLTDEVPQVPCLVFDRDHMGHFDHLHTRLHLSVFPWVSADSIKRLYLEIQRVAFGHSQNRATSIRMLKLFDFVSERRTCTNPMPWRGVMQAWDRKQPKELRYGRYGEHGVRVIERDYDRVRAQVVWMRSDRVSREDLGKPKRRKLKQRA